MLRLGDASDALLLYKSTVMLLFILQSMLHYCMSITTVNYALFWLRRLAEALTESGSGHFRGSAFTACLVAQAAREHGLLVPLPEDDLDSERVSLPLPFSPPPHSFSTPATAQLSIIKPSSISFEEFVGRMMDVKEFLIENSLNVFNVTGSKSLVSWTSIRVLPVDLTAEVVGEIGVKADSADFVTRFNETCQCATVAMEGPSPTTSLQGGLLSS
jgi:hypothetical protein